MFLNIIYKDHATNEEVRNKVQDSTEKHVVLLTICNILRFFTAVKYGNFQMKNCDNFLIFRTASVLTSTHNLCY